MILFIFFALPLAIILLSIVLQKILRSPILVAITVFAILLIVAFTAFSDTLAEALVATIIYTIIAFITAVIVMIICRLRRKINCNCCSNNNLNLANQLLSSQSVANQAIASSRNCNCGNNDGDDDENITESNNLLTISCRCGNGSQSSDLLTVDSTCFANDINNNNVTEELNEFVSEPAITTTNQIQNNAVVYGNTNSRRNIVSRRYYRR